MQGGKRKIFSLTNDIKTEKWEREWIIERNCRTNALFFYESMPADPRTLLALSLFLHASVVVVKGDLQPHVFVG